MPLDDLEQAGRDVGLRRWIGQLDERELAEELLLVLAPLAHERDRDLHEADMSGLGHFGTPRSARTSADVGNVISHHTRLPTPDRSTPHRVESSLTSLMPRPVAASMP